MLWRYGKHRGAAPTGGNWRKLRFGAAPTGGKQQKLRFGEPRRVEIDENCVSGSSDGRKLAKTAFRGAPTGGNWQKLRFGEPRRVEIGKNCVSGSPDGRKTAKTVFRGTPTGEKQRKLRFGEPRRAEKRKKPPRYGGKSSKIGQFCSDTGVNRPFLPKNRVSNPLENEKHSFSAFPTPWKAKNAHFLHFQPLGKLKTLNFCVSNPLESQKRPFSAFPTPWKARKREKTASHPRMTGEKQQILGFIHG